MPNGHPSAAHRIRRPPPRAVGRRTAISPSPDARDDRPELALLVLKRLAAALHTYRLYGPAHPLTRTALADLAGLAARYLRQYGELRVEVMRGGSRFAFDDTERMSDQVAPLLAALHARGMRELRFTSTTTEVELRELLAMLVLPIETVRAANGPAAILRGRAVGTITIREIAPVDEERSAGETRPVAPPVAAAILRQFVATARHIRLYGERHPIVSGAVGDLFAILDSALAGAGSLRYEIRSGSVFAASVPVQEDPLVAAAFASDCAARHIDSLTFAQGLTREELAQTVALFARDPEALVVEGGFPEALRVRQVAHVS